MSDIIQADTIGSALEKAAAASPNETMMIYDGKEISFGEVHAISDRVACGLLEMGFQKGDKIGIIGLNQPEWLYTYFAAAKIGAVVTGLSVRYRDSELDYILNQSGTRAVLSLATMGDMNYVSFFRDFREKIPSVSEFIFMGGEGFEGSFSFDALMNTDLATDALDRAKASVVPVDDIMIIYTSGTTGTPKGAVITHRSQLASATAQAVHTRVGPEDIFPLALPLNHVGGITCGVLTSLLGRAKYVLIPVFSPDGIVAQCAKYRMTMANGVPTMHVLLLMTESYRALDHSGVRLVIIGGSNADATLLKQLEEAYPKARVMNLYGLSETSGMVVMSPWESDFDMTIQSIGKPIGPVEVKVVDEMGNELPPGEIGELCFRGDAVVKGYHGMPDKTNETFKDGWLSTGDMGLLNEEGYIFLKGRKKEMYIQGGFNVYPVEVENVIAGHPKVAMVAGIGVKDEVLGEVGRYYIIPAPGTEPTEEEIKAFCKERLADYKVPRQIVFRKELPMTPAGKIMKSALEKEG
ncbi:MAG: acyl--CoA ligase [Deltaproteobacteria bacterium]|nr:acyl--CoA ligase [Deltaproteobacteria bacterium]